MVKNIGNVAASYRGAKCNSKDRGIEFHFTQDEWVTWWVQHLGPDWLKMRGCRSGQYVMARNGDEGPYADWNVRCITVEENHAEWNRLSGLRRRLGLPSKLDELILLSGGSVR